MAYKFDSDLEFLRELESEELDSLVEILTKDKDGETRISEFLTTNDLFKKFYPNHKEYVELIMNELQEFGGNSFLNLFRGGGVLYKEILCDVCDKMKVNYNKNSSAQTIEINLLMKVLQTSLDEMSEEEKRDFIKELDIKTTDFSSQGVTAALQALIKIGGFKSYTIILKSINLITKILIGRGLSFAANRAIVKTTSILAGPVGWILTGAWTAIDLAGPAYRVTVPAVVQVAYLRQYHLSKK